MAGKVIVAWPSVGEAALCNILQLVDQHLMDDLSGPKRCLVPQAGWLEVTPISKVHASDSERYSLCNRGAERGMFCVVPEQDLFCNQYGVKVLNGAMCVDKLKIVHGESQHLLRFISNLTPLNAFMRKLRGDENTFPQVVFLSRIILGGGGFLTIDG